MRTNWQARPTNIPVLSVTFALTLLKRVEQDMPKMRRNLRVWGCGGKVRDEPSENYWHLYLRV